MCHTAEAAAIAATCCERCSGGGFAQIEFGAAFSLNDRHPMAYEGPAATEVAIVAAGSAIVGGDCLRTEYHQFVVDSARIERQYDEGWGNAESSAPSNRRADVWEEETL